MRPVLLALLSLLGLSDVAASVTRRDMSHVVWSYVAPERQGHVAEAVAIINAEKLPPKHKRLVVRVMPYTSCEGLPKRRDGITLCPSTVFAHDVKGETTRGRYKTQIRVVEAFDPAYPLMLFCHELSHAVTRSGAHGDWIWEEPCPFDTQAMAAKQRKTRHR
jgi:hypothetical protein